MTHPHGHQRGPRTYEKEGTNVKAVAIFAVSLLLGIGVIQLATYGLFGLYRPTPQERPPPLPRRGDAGIWVDHWLDPPQDLAKLRELESNNLNRLQWIDQQSGLVRIPIDLAMKLQVQRGWGQPTGSQTDAGGPP
jgi:hypothetical protein